MTGRPCRRIRGFGRLGGRNRRADAGITMIELVVSMSVMALAMTIFTAAVVQMFRVSTKTEEIAIAQAQATAAFTRLEKELRYAAGISTPGTVGSDWYLEYVITNTGTTTCGQVRLHASSSVLQWRTWKRDTETPPSDWTALAGSLVVQPNTATATSTPPMPFTFLPASETGYEFQRLRIYLVTRYGTTSKTTDVTFTALNTSLKTADNPPTTACVVRG